MARHQSDDRGREADSPSEIPKAGWKDILFRVKDEISDDRVMLIAAGVTFYILLALVPGLTALVSIYGLFADPATVQQQVAQLQGIIPAGGIQIIEDQLSRLASQGSTTLGITFAISLGISLWSANSGVKSLFEAMNVAYDEHETRGFFKLNLLSLSFTIAAIVMAILIMGLVLVMPAVLSALQLGTAIEWIVRIVGYVVLALVASLGIAALYRWGADRDEAEWKWITPGSIVTLVAWLIMSVLFSWYAANLGSYNATYGSLGSLIAFLFWVWLSVNILIVGAELNSEIEHQTKRDTTEGRSQPMGRRGAHVADTVGESR